jgi:hypothetical protein
MKDYGSDYPVIRPKMTTILAIFLVGLMIFIGESVFLLRLAGVASGPAAHPAPAHLAHLLPSPSQSLPTDPQAPPNGMDRVLLAEVER